MVIVRRMLPTAFSYVKIVHRLVSPGGKRRLFNGFSVALSLDKNDEQGLMSRSGNVLPIRDVFPTCQGTATGRSNTVPFLPTVRSVA
jgi:hypothetical protein